MEPHFVNSTNVKNYWYVCDWCCWLVLQDDTKIFTKHSLKSLKCQCDDSLSYSRLKFDILSVSVCICVCVLFSAWHEKFLTVSHVMKALAHYSSHMEDNCKQTQSQKKCPQFGWFPLIFQSNNITRIGTCIQMCAHITAVDPQVIRNILGKNRSFTTLHASVNYPYYFSLEVSSWKNKIVRGFRPAEKHGQL